MSKQRYINTKIWEDAWFSDLDQIEQLVFIYFLTNPMTNIIGAYELSKGTIGRATGLESRVVEEMLNRFEKAGKVYYVDGWVIIANFIKHQNYRSPKIQAGIENELKDIPDNVKKWIGIPYPYGIDTLSHLIKSNLIKSNSNLIKDIAPTKVVAVAIKAKREPNPIIPLTVEMLEERLTKMESEEGSALDIIATYIREKPVHIENSKQLSLTIGRFARIAKAAEGAYTNKEIMTAIDDIKKDNQDRERKGQAPVNWTVETIIKTLIKK
ncbi:MAG: hypothetical protein M3P98_01475 [bacterium]|nr:hypothetical protein [bacterium]